MYTTADEIMAISENNRIHKHQEEKARKIKGLNPGIDTTDPRDVEHFKITDLWEKSME